MLIARIEGTTRVCGKSQGYLGMPVRDETIEGGINIMHVAWEPTPEELKLLNKGANVITSTIGISPQPMKVGVGKLDVHECKLYDYRYNSTIGGYVVFRSHTFATRPEFAPSTFYLENHKVAIFVTENEAGNYCEYRNDLVIKNGSDRLPD